MKTPPHIAPVWYFTPFYSMLRATNDQMVTVLCAITGLATVAGLLRARGAGKLIVLVGGLVLVALLKAFDAKFWGVVVMGGAVVILFGLPWLDHCAVKSIRYRPSWHKIMYAIFVVFFVVLGYLGIQPPSDTGTMIAQVGTLFYFGFFLLMPWWSQIGQCKPVPDRVTFAAH
jgi:ubiquinol-cytochrome c reductase cytochrome b subunit